MLTGSPSLFVPSSSESRKHWNRTTRVNGYYELDFRNAFGHPCQMQAYFQRAIKWKVEDTKFRLVVLYIPKRLALSYLFELLQTSHT